MIFVDTGAWFAALVPSDPDQSRRGGWHSTPLTLTQVDL